MLKAALISLKRASASQPFLGLAAGLCLGLAPKAMLAPAWAEVCLALGCLGLASSLLAWMRLRPACAALLMAASGLALGAWRGQELFARLTDMRQDFRSAVRMEAVVAEDLGENEESGRRSLRLRDALITVPNAPPQAWDGELRLSMDSRECRLNYGPGDKIRAYGSLRRPSGPMNPGEFDYRAYLLGRGITGSVSARKGMPPEIISPGSWLGFRRLAWRARLALQGGLETRLSRRGADLARGMVLGDTGGLNAKDMSVYARTGIVHILSVSGLHLALALAIFLWIGKRLGLTRRALAWLALLGAFFYAAICGLPVPCQRALVLFGLALLGRALDLETDLVTSLSFGACVILLLQPGALFEAGAQMSFLVSLSLVTLTPRFEALLPEIWPSWLKLLLAAALTAELATVPLVAWHFKMLCWPSLFASIATAPLMGPIVGLGLGCAALGQWLPLAWPLEGSLKILDWITARFAALPYAAFSTGRVSWEWMLLWCLGLVALAMLPNRTGKIGSALALAALLAALIWQGLPWAHKHPGLTKAWFFSVGQGDACLAEFGDGSLLLVDAGPLKPDAGSWVLGPALRSLGINRLDTLVVTHPHADHYGGMFWMLEQFKVGKLLTSGQESGARSWAALKRVAREHGVPWIDVSEVGLPQDLGAKLRLLAPFKPPLEGTKHDMHNNGIVLDLGGWLLLSGDMQREGEARLLKLGRLRPVDLLKLGHHGSSTSSSPAFLKALNPKTAVISCGLRNRYGHPSASTLEHLQGRALYRTDLQGCIRVEHDASGTRLWPWNVASAASLWQAPSRHRPPFPWKLKAARPGA